MLIFIDDSGDPGFKLDKGSTKFFVISLVIFDDELEAEKTAVAIKELKRTLHFPDSVEFKFHKSSGNVRKRFLETIIPFSFRVRSIIIEKNFVRSDELKKDKNSFYGYAIKTVLKKSDGTIREAKIKIDGSGDRVFRRTFIAYLRKHLNSEDRQILKQCRFVDSKGDVLIQMADMVAGAIRRSYESEKDDNGIYKRIIRKRIEDEWKFR